MYLVCAECRASQSIHWIALQNVNSWVLIAPDSKIKFLILSPGSAKSNNAHLYLMKLFAGDHYYSRWHYETHERSIRATHKICQLC